MQSSGGRERPHELHADRPGCAETLASPIPVTGAGKHSSWDAERVTACDTANEKNTEDKLPPSFPPPTGCSEMPWRHTSCLKGCYPTKQLAVFTVKLWLPGCALPANISPTASGRFAHRPCLPATTFFLPKCENGYSHLCLCFPVNLDQDRGLLGKMIRCQSRERNARDAPGVSCDARKPRNYQILCSRVKRTQELKLWNGLPLAKDGTI